MQQEIAQINLFKEAEENRKLKRELSTTITSNSACVTWVGTSGQKYWRDITSSTATGYCWTSSESTTNWGSSTNSKWTSDTTNFPTGTGYFLCPVSMSNSFCGASFDDTFSINDGIDTIISAYYIASGEMWDYTVKINDSSASKFTVTVLTATNLSVLMAKQISTSSYSSATTLSTGTSYSQTASYGETYSILARASGGSGTLVILIQSPKTGSTATKTDNTPIIIGVIVGASYFIFPWTIMFIIMLILWLKKTLFPKHHQNPQQRRPPVIYDNYATPNSNPYNQNDPDVQRAIFMSMNPPLRNSAEAAHPTYQTNYYNNEYARGLPISLSGPNSQINVNNNRPGPPPAASLSHGRI